MAKSFEEIQAILKSCIENGDQSSAGATDVWELAAEAERVATEILSTKSDEYVLDFISIIMSCVFTYFVQIGDMPTAKAILMSSDEDVTNALALSIKLAIGFSVMEELR